MLSQITHSLIFRGIGLASMFWASFGLLGGQLNTNLEQPPTKECSSCHSMIGDHWSESAHGLASENEAFISAWDEQENLPVCMTCHATGYDASTLEWDFPGVTCQTCHTPYNENHPDEVMPTDVSSRLCGNCHLDTFTQWQDSVHSNEDLSCNQCHNAHTTSLKAENSQVLCQSCHREQVHSFELTVHASNGLLCTDCHLRVSDVELGEGHGKRVHTFEVDLKTCTDCHGDGLHAASLDNGGSPQNTDEMIANAFPVQAGLQPEPAAVSPTGYTILASLLGVGFGMVMAPWLEKWFRRFRS